MSGEQPTVPSDFVPKKYYLLRLENGGNRVIAETLQPMTVLQTVWHFNTHYVPKGVILDYRGYAKQGAITYCLASALGE